MTQQEKREVKKLWVMLAAYYQREVIDEVVLMYTEDLSDLPCQEVLRAMHDYRRSPRNRRMPLPADIRELVQPEKVDDELLAAEAVGRIITAISKIGSWNPQEAEKYIGPLGWQVVQKQGGWANLCQNLLSENVGIFQAQAKTLARAQLALARAGKIDGPELPPATKGKLDELGANIKRLV